jgi:putative Ca2+/H+ antiporter (TMEM165/GDT1 family)
VALFAVLPGRVVDVVAGAMFVAGGIYALLEARSSSASPEVGRAVSGHHIMTAAFVVIFVAEWGDLTQILTANLAARYHSALGVGIGAVLALWAVAGLAVLGGHGLLRRVPVAIVRRVTGVLLLVLGGIALWAGIVH